MVFSINAKFEGDKTMAQFKQLAIQKNGTTLGEAAIQQVNPAAAAAPSTVTVQAGGGAGAAATSGAVAPGAPAASVVAGSGTDGAGQACTCQCLCGVNAFPPQAAVNSFGGFAGMIN